MIIALFVLLVLSYTGWGLSPIGCFKRLEAGEPFSALRYGERLLEAGNKDYSTYLCMGRASYELRNYPLAVSYLSRALAQSRSQLERFVPLVYMAMSYERMGDRGKAIENYRRALEIAKGVGGDLYISVLRALGELYEREGNYAEALKLYMEVLDASSKEEDMLWATERMGMVYARMGRYEEALKVLDKALQIANSDGNASAVSRVLTTIGDVYMQMGQPDRAVGSYEEAIRYAKASGNPILEAGLREKLGDAYLSKGDLRASKESYETALAIYERERNRQRMRRVQERIQLINMLLQVERRL